METGPREVLGAAVVTAWIEQGPPSTLKIRVTAKRDVERHEVTIGVTADIDAACDLVRGWLESIIEHAVTGNDWELANSHGRYGRRSAGT